MNDTNNRLIVSKGITHGAGNLSDATHIALYSKEETEVDTFAKMLDYGFYQEIVDKLNSQVINQGPIRELLRTHDEFINYIFSQERLGHGANSALKTFLEREIEEHGFNKFVLLFLEKKSELLKDSPKLIQQIIRLFYENRDERNKDLLVPLFQNHYDKSWLETTTYDDYYGTETVEIKEELIYQLIEIIISDESLYLIFDKINEFENIISNEILKGYFVKLGDNVDQNKFLNFYRTKFPAQFDNVFLEIAANNLNLTNVLLRFLHNAPQQREFLLNLYLKNSKNTEITEYIVKNHLHFFTEENMENHDVPNKKIIFFKGIVNLAPNNIKVYLPMIHELKEHEELILNDLYRVIPESEQSHFLYDICKVLSSKRALNFAKEKLNVENFFFGLLYESQQTPTTIRYIMTNIAPENVKEFLEDIDLLLKGNDNKSKKQRDISGFLKMGWEKFDTESWSILFSQLTSTCDVNLCQNYFNLPLKDINEESANAFYNAINPNQHKPIKTAFETFMRENEYLKEKSSPWREEPIRLSTIE